MSSLRFRLNGSAVQEDCWSSLLEEDVHLLDHKGALWHFVWICVGDQILNNLTEWEQQKEFIKRYMVSGKGRLCWVTSAVMDSVCILDVSQIQTKWISEPLRGLSVAFIAKGLSIFNCTVLHSWVSVMWFTTGHSAAPKKAQKYTLSRGHWRTQKHRTVTWSQNYCSIRLSLFCMYCVGMCHVTVM